jgi:hypothetical protein
MKVFTQPRSQTSTLAGPPVMSGRCSMPAAAMAHKYMRPSKTAMLLAPMIGPGHHLALAEALQDAHVQRSWVAVRMRGQGRDERGLVARTALGGAAAALAAPVDIVDLDHRSELPVSRQGAQVVPRLPMAADSSTGVCLAPWAAASNSRDYAGWGGT